MQIVELSTENLSQNEGHTLACVRKQNIEVHDCRNGFLKNIGGQSHVQCEKHLLPLIESNDRSKRCNCGKL